ncbi:MAG: hypothetical protein AAB731_03735 [Patescibacteria group bacterium]
MSKRKIILTVAIILVLGSIPAAIFGYPYFKTYLEDREFLANPAIHDQFVAARDKEREIKTNPERLETYVSAMMRYKGLGDVTKDKRFYYRALDIEARATKKFGVKSYLPALNASTIYMSLGEYEKAETNIKKAIEMAPGDAQLYLRLIELYKDFMKKDEASVIAVYETGIQRLVNVLPLYNSYAAYLREINRLEESLDKYRILRKAAPDNPLYGQQVKELELLVKDRGL